MSVADYSSGQKRCHGSEKLGEGSEAIFFNSLAGYAGLAAGVVALGVDLTMGHLTTDFLKVAMAVGIASETASLTGDALYEFTMERCRDLKIPRTGQKINNGFWNCFHIAAMFTAGAATAVPVGYYLTHFIK